MNKNIFVTIATLCLFPLLAQWNFDEKAGLKFFHNGKLVLEEKGLTKHDFAKKSKSPYVSCTRVTKKINKDFHIAVKAEFNPLDFAPEYRLFIPQNIINGAKINALSHSKKGKVSQKIPKTNKWMLKDVVFLVIEKDNLKFALDFEGTGSMAYQHYRDQAWAALIERHKNGLNIRLPRKYVGNFGGFFTADIVLRTTQIDYTKLHGNFQAHYKVNLPVTRFFKFTPNKERPSSIGGVVTRDNDIKIVTKRFSKGMLIPITKNIPAKFGTGGWSASKLLKFNANKTDNPIYSHAVTGGSKDHSFTASLPDGYYFLTFMVQDDSVKNFKTYQVEVNGKKYTIPVKGKMATATRCIVKVTGEKLTVNFPKTTNLWHLSALSAIWLCGIGDADINIDAQKEFQL